MSSFSFSDHDQVAHSGTGTARSGEVHPSALPHLHFENAQLGRCAEPRAEGCDGSLKMPAAHSDPFFVGVKIGVLQDLWNTANLVHETPMLRLDSEMIAHVSTLATIFKHQLVNYSPYQAVAGVTSLANIGYRDLSLFHSLHDHIKGRGVEMSVPTLVDLAWSCGKLAIRDGALFDTIKKMALSKQRAAYMHHPENPRSAMSSKDRALIAWGGAVGCPEDKRQNFVKQFVHPQDLEDSSVPLNHWHLMYQSLVISGLLDGSESFDQLQLLQERSDERYEERIVNKFEGAVLNATLNVIGQPKDLSYHVHERIAGVEADLVIRAPEGMVVIESDGEAFHRLIGPDGGMLQGKDQGQDIFFSRLGVKAVIHIGSHEWDSTWGEDILREKIKAHAPFLLNRP